MISENSFVKVTHVNFVRWTLFNDNCNIITMSWKSMISLSVSIAQYRYCNCICGPSVIAFFHIYLIALFYPTISKLFLGVKTYNVIREGVWNPAAKRKSIRRSTWSTRSRGSWTWRYRSRYVNVYSWLSRSYWPVTMVKAHELPLDKYFR